MVELEKLGESSDVDLDEVICFGSLCSVMILELLFSTGISITDVVTGNSIHPIEFGTLYVE